MKSKTYDSYPCGTIIISNAVSLGIYVLGAWIIYRLGTLWMILYLVYILLLEIRLMAEGCRACHYYGRLCAFGRGRMASIFFRKGETSHFTKKKITWKDMIPDVLVSVIPLIAGIVLLIRDFSWWLLLPVILLVFLNSAGNGFVRGSLACRFCRQRELGCPAEQLFRPKR